MARLSDHLDAHKRTHTLGLDAVAADIRRGKRAFAGGVEVVGSADVKPLSLNTARSLLLVQNPTGISSGSYNMATPANGGVIVQSNRIQGLVGANVNINTNGYVYTSVSYQDILNYTGAPRANGYQRKYELWGSTKNAALTTGKGARIAFNVEHWYNQFWYVELYWNAGVFTLWLREWNSPTGTTRGTVSFGAGVDEPIVWHMVVYDAGDTIWCTATIYESDAITDDEGVAIGYTVANRPYKDSMGAFIGVREDPGDEWLIRGWSVSDVP